MRTILKIMLLVSVLILASCGSNKEEVKKENIQKQNIEQKVDNKEKENSEKIKNEIKDNVDEISQKVLNWEMTQEQAQKAMLDSINKSWTVQDQLSKMKKQMPLTLEMMKTNLSCIEKADNKSDMIKCGLESNKMAKKLELDDFEAFDESEYDNWTKDEKEADIKDLKNAIKDLEEMMPCIKKAEKMTDVMKCNKENNL